MSWEPIAVGRKLRKDADRRNGCELILPWPDGLPSGPPLALDEAREATAEEDGAARRITADLGLAHLSTVAARLRRPDGASMERRGEAADHLVVMLLHPRWTGVSRAGPPSVYWLPAGRIAEA